MRETLQIASFEWKLIFQALIWQGLCEFTGGYPRSLVITVSYPTWLMYSGEFHIDQPLFHGMQPGGTWYIISCTRICQWAMTS